MNGRDDEIDDAIAVEGRLYLLTANAACWKCRQPQDVVVRRQYRAFAAPKFPPVCGHLFAV
jgi:hypothetical protein